MSNSNGPNFGAVLLGGHEAKKLFLLRTRERSESVMAAGESADRFRFDSMCGVLSGSPRGRARGAACGCDARRAGAGAVALQANWCQRVRHFPRSLPWRRRPRPSHVVVAAPARRSVRSAALHRNDGWSARVVAVRRAAMPCEATSALGSWNATARLFFFSFVAHATTTSGIAHVLLFFRRAPVLAAGVRRGDDEDIRYLRGLTSATARNRVIPGRGNSNNLRAEAGQQRFAVWKRTFQCHHGTEEKGPGRWWNGRKSPGTGRGK